MAKYALYFLKAALTPRHQRTTKAEPRQLSSKAQANSTTYRAQGLPSHCTWERTESLIASAVGFVHGQYSIFVPSLAYSVGYSGEKTASISSEDLSRKSQEQKSQWTFTLSKQMHDSDDGRP